MHGEDEAWEPPDLSVLGIDPAAEVFQMPAPEMATAVAAVVARNHDALMSRLGVVMLGETLDAKGDPAILIGVRTTRDLGRLPTSIDGFPVVAQVVGEVKAL